MVVAGIGPFSPDFSKVEPTGKVRGTCPQCSGWSPGPEASVSPGAYETGRISGSTLALLNQNLHVNKIPSPTLSFLPHEGDSSVRRLKFEKPHVELT